MGTAEEAAAGEVTDRKAWFYLNGPSIVPLSLPPHPILDVVPACKTEPVEVQRAEQSD